MFYRAAKMISVPLVHTLWRPRIEGREHVPASGAAILAANHLSALDSFFLPTLLPRRVTYVAKKEYFTGNPMMRMLMGSSIAVDRDDAGAAQAMLDAALAVLRGGGLFGIYPEGTRSPDGRLYKGKIGAAWLALSSGAPIVPVAMSGTDKVLPPGASVPRLHKIGIRIGAPMTFTGDPGKARDRREVTDQMMAAIQKLSGQEYVPAYSRRPA